LRLRFGQPIGAQPQRMQDLLRERLARLELPEPVRSVRLLSGPLLDLQSEPVELFAHDRRESGENLPQLIERLRARLGHEAVHGLACVAEHRPEAAWRAVEPAASRACHSSMKTDARRGTTLASAAEVARGTGEGALRPLWLLEVPEPCDAIRLELEDGPECIESGWWDGHDVARDYYVARNRDGARLWIFRNRRDTDPAGWFLHGWFA
jgi:protein ImuB